MPLSVGAALALKTLLAISPHLDDAIFSAGALLWSLRQRGWRVVVATVFTGNVERPSGFALACQLDKGLSADIDYMALRRQEDRRACALLDVEPDHLPLLEAPHRGYANALALFDKVLPHDQIEDQVRRELTSVLADVQPHVILAPLAVGGHVDHVIVRRAVEALTAPRGLWLWEDWPYVDRGGSTERRGSRALTVSSKARRAKINACACYASQLGFQFGGAGALAAALDEQKSEWYRRARAMTWEPIKVVRG